VIVQGPKTDFSLLKLLLNVKHLSYVKDAEYVMDLARLV